ncbi:MAG: hypothetical protein IT245_04955 [Bacteroidia bacterium]|nr:hypothetical protein [Bacteroidia bacterium]
MIRLFSYTFNQTILFLFIFTIIIRTSGLLVPYVNTTQNLNINYLSDFFNSINEYSIVGFIISTLFVFVTALAFNHICIKHELIIFPSYLPAYFFILLNSVFVDQFYAGPVIFVNFFLIISLGAILNLFQSENPSISIFAASTLAGLSALMNMTYIAFFIVVVIGINIFRSFNFRENISALIGFLLPLYVGTMINYLINGNFLPYYIFFPDYGHFNNQYWALQSALPSIGLVGILATIRMYNNFYRNSTKQRRSIQFMLILLITSVILMITGKQNPRQEFSFVAIPLAFSFSFYFSNSKINILKEIVNMLLIIAILFFRNLQAHLI